MKKILWIFLALIFLVVAGLFIFIATFDADRYRPLLVQKIEEATGKKATLGRVSLGWEKGVALRAHDLKIYSGAVTQGEVLAKMDQASAVVRLMPLLKKDIQISSILIKAPFFGVVKDASGGLSVAGVELAQPPTAQPDKAKKIAAAPLLSIDLVKIVDGQLKYEDRSQSSPMAVTISSFDAEVRNFSFNAPVDFELQAAIFGNRQNIDIKGQLSLPQGSKAALLKNFNLKVDLASIDKKALTQAFPSFGLQDLSALSGNLEITAKNMDLDPKTLLLGEADVLLKDGEVAFKSMQTPIDHLRADMAMSGGDLNIRDLSGNMAEGSFKISGTVKRFMTEALSDVKASFENLSLDLLMPAESSAARISGRLSLGLEGRAQGMAWPQISQTLSGRGRLILKDGVLVNYNVLREIIQKLSQIPGVGDSIQNNFPEMYKAKLGEPSTILKPVDLSFTMSGGKMNVDNFLLATDVISVAGSGQLGLDKSIQVQASLMISPQVSGALMQAAPSLSILSGSQGAIEVPAQITGVLPRVMVIPDTQYLFSRIATSKAPELLNSLLKKTGSAAEQGASEGSSSLADLLGKALKKSE